MIKVTKRAATAAQILAVYTAVVATLAFGFMAYGVFRIQDCTTPGGDCYRKARTSSMDFRSDVNRGLNQLQARLLEASNCIIEQQAEHRDSNESAHQINAAEHGYTYSAPEGEVPPPIPEQLKHACEPFLPPTQGGTK